MAKLKGLKAEIGLFYEGKDISGSIADDLISLSYTDSLEKKDDLQIKLNNTTGKWLNKWFPSKGSQLNANIVFNGSKLDLGMFTIDDLSYSESPSVFTIKAVTSLMPKPKPVSKEDITKLNQRRKEIWCDVRLSYIVKKISEFHGLEYDYSVPYDITIERVVQDESDKSFLEKLALSYKLNYKFEGKKIAIFDHIKSIKQRTKETFVNITLEEIVKNTAKKHGLEHIYSADEIFIERIIQDESDLSFIKRLATKYALNFKVNNEKIIVFSGSKYEENEDSILIEKGISNIESCSFNTKTHKIYSSVVMTYQDITGKSFKTYRWAVPNAPFTEELKIPDKGEMTLAEAEKKAKGAIKSKNKHETTANIKFLGNPLIRTGGTVIIKGYGAFDGKYFIDESKHDLGSAYTTNVNLKKELVGYE